MLARHLAELSNPPFKIGQRVRIREDGAGGEVYLVIGLDYEHRMVPARGWSLSVATEDDLESGGGGITDFSPEDLEHA